MARSYFVPYGSAFLVSNVVSVQTALDYSEVDTTTPAVIVLLLGPDRELLEVVNVFDAVGPDAADDVAECLLSLTRTNPPDGAVVVSARPTLPPSDADVDRWFSLCAQFEAADVQLVDWLIVHRHQWTSIRESVGFPPRWERRSGQPVHGVVRY